jgi:glycosyltransferase involved in cell wall biosynthesis
MKISVIAPVLNEAPWIGYSVMAALPYVHEFLYALDEKTSDGTRELLDFIGHRYAFEKLKVFSWPNFHPSDEKAYNGAFNECIRRSTGDVCWFLHPDMVITRWSDPPEGPLAWWTEIRSFAGDFKTRILRGRADKWKNLHAKTFGLHYAGGYGSQNEDFYHSLITGTTHKHYGTDFDKYPFEVASSGISVNHYCEVKDYKRRLEKMKFCLKTQYPSYDEKQIEDLATRHQRVTLEEMGSDGFRYEYGQTSEPIPDVILKHKKEFEEVIHG